MQKSPDTKRCNHCLTDKPIDNFPITTNKKYKDRVYRRGTCKQCTNSFAKDRYYSDYEFRKLRLAAAKKVRKKTRDSRRDYKLRRAFGISLDDWNLLLEEQGGKCAICSTTEPGSMYNTFATDHCHKTGKVRGLLCWHCNSALGKFQDSIELLHKAIEYLKRHQ